MLMKSSWVRTGSARFLLFCLGATDVVCLPRVARESHQLLVLLVAMMNRAYAAPLIAVQANRALTQGCHAVLAVCTDAQPAADEFRAAVSDNADAQSTVDA